MSAQGVLRSWSRDVARGAIVFGGDYNPEQWPEAVWAEDVALMRAARVNLVTVGVFSWARLEPSPGERDLGWLERVLDLLHDGGIGVDLATPVASPPPWLGHRYPETLPVMPDGTVLHAGSRNHFCPSSPDYRDAARSITTELVARFADHPAVRMWHVGNEYGQFCWCDRTAAAFRDWLRARHGGLAELNSAWGTSFWSQAYGDWDEILPPRSAPYLVNPGQELDFKRFASDALLGLYREQRALIRAADPGAVVTTNFMGFFPGLDSWTWTGDVDIPANDVYLDPADPLGHVDVAMSHDLTRGLGSRGAGTDRPWMLMEHATSAVNWRQHNLAKPAGRIALDAMQAVARGAGAVCYFQWRQSRFGAEMAHSAMLPNAGADTRVHREVRALGATLAQLGELAPSLVSETPAHVRADVAVLFDWASWWASGHRSLPSDRIDAVEQLRRWYGALHAETLTADLVGPGTPLDGYRLVLVPQLYLVEPETAKRLEAFVASGGHLVVGPFSGLVDGAGQLGEGRFPAALRELLGVSGEEWRPLAGPQRCIADPQTLQGLEEFTVETWAEHLRCDGATAVAWHDGDDAVLAGHPAITRRATGTGTGTGTGTVWYVSVVPDPATLSVLTRRWAAEAGVASVLPERTPGVEAVRRGDLTFVLNHNDFPVTVALPGTATLTDLLTGVEHAGELALANHATAVLRPAQMETHP